MEVKLDTTELDTTVGVGISRIGQIAINASDVERAATFYQDALGLKLLFKAGPGLAFFDCGGVRLMLTRPENPEFEPIVVGPGDAFEIEGLAVGLIRNNMLM